MDEKICMKESPLCFLASKAKLAICIIAACLDLPVYMVLVSKRLLPSGHSVPRSFSIRGYCSQLFPNTPLRPASYRRNYTTLWVHGPQVFHKSTQTDIQKAILFFYRCSKDQMMLEHFMTCWNILGVIQGSRRSHPPKLTPLDMNIHCWSTTQGLKNTFKSFVCVTCWLHSFPIKQNSIGCIFSI